MAFLLPSQFTPPFGSWERLSPNPVISPQGADFESAGTFNPAVVEKDGKVVMLYRAQDKKGTSRLGYAESVDGIHFRRSAKPVFGPEVPYERVAGQRIPASWRSTCTYYLTYTGYNNVDEVGRQARCTVVPGHVERPVDWVRHGVILPAYRGGWNVG